MIAPGPRPLFLLALLLIAAAILQGSVSPRLYLLGGQPDFVFAVAISAALLTNAGTGSLLGLGGGLVSAALVSEAVGTLLTSRVLAGFVAGWFAGRLFRTNAGVVVASLLVASFVAQAVFLLAAPRAALPHAFPGGLIGAAWNALLGIPATLLLRRSGWGHDPG